MRSWSKSLLVALVVLAACGARQSEPTIWDPPRPSQPVRPEFCASPPRASTATPVAAAPEWIEIHENLVCTTPEHTEGERDGECGARPDYAFFADALRGQALPCGPCGFEACKRATLEARAKRSNACCYIAFSPSRG